jgi:signal transduction histidine kinase
VADDHLTFPDPPKTALDARVSELVAAANDVLRTQGRLRSLLRASKQILADLDLPSVRDRVVDAAMDITAARYGALGVVVPGDGMDLHVHPGEGVAAAVVHLTGTDSLLAAVTDSPGAIRLDDLTQDPRTRDMPSWLPPMHSFLGVPLQVCGEPYCNLYLTESAHGAFTEEDEQLVLSLVSTTELALENARLYAGMQRRQAWALASAEVTERLQTDRPEGAIRTLADWLLRLPEMQAVLVLTLLPDGHRFAVRAYGDDALPDRPAVLDVAGSLPGRVVTSGHPVALHEHEPAGLPGWEGFGPLLALPLVGGANTFGVLVLARRRAADSFSSADEEMATEFAAKVSVALQLRAARDSHERVVLFEDRARIARDLHDRVIQDLFATGLDLQAVSRAEAPQRMMGRVTSAVDRIDAVILQIRRIVSTLSAPDPAATCCARIEEFVADLSARLQVHAVHRTEGAVETVLGPALLDDVLAVIGEGVTNAVKHAGATSVQVTLTGGAHGLAVEIENDGRPFEPGSRRSGLANLEARAHAHHGEFSVAAGEQGGRLRWTAAVPDG